MAGTERYHPTEVIARFLLLTPRRVRQLTAEGVFTRARDPETGEFLRGRYSLVETTHAYIKFLREGKLDDPDESNYIRSRSRRMHAIAEEAELRLKVIKGKLHRAEDVEFLMTQRDTAIKAQFLAIPSRTARFLVGKTDYQEIYNLLMAEVLAVLENLSGYDPRAFNEQNEKYLAGLSRLGFR